MKTTRHEKDRPLVRISHWFFTNWRYTFLLWVVILVGGAVTYTSLIKREGFPSIQFPLTVVRGTYFVDDTSRVDQDLTQPIAIALKDVPGLESSQTIAGPNFFSVLAQFESEVSPTEGTVLLKSAIDSVQKPDGAQLNYTTVDPAAFLNKYDVLLSAYALDDAESVSELQSYADNLVLELNKDTQIVGATVEKLVSTGLNPVTQKEESRQTAFSRIGIKEGDQVNFYRSITIGIDRDKENMDVLEFSAYINKRVEEVNNASQDSRIKLAVSADFAQSIETQISSLETNLRDGLIAVALVSFLLITWRASVITGLFMVSVMAIVIGVLYAIGYSLNTITLFALVLSLGLFVDDATIVVEALDAHRTRKKRPSDIVRLAIKRVGTASFAGTFTTILVFLPLVFISGVLGEFIRLMPITIILSLLASLVLSLTMIPLLSKFLLLRGHKQGLLDKLNPVSKVESSVGRFVGSLPMQLKKKPVLKGRILASVMVLLSIGLIAGSGLFAQKLTFNIFPPSKDSDQIGIQLNFPNGYTLAQAEAVADSVNQIINSELQGLVQHVTYGNNAEANERSAGLLVELTPFNQRDPKSPELINKLQTSLNRQIDQSVSIRVLQFDAGPPQEEFPFKTQIYTDDIQKAQLISKDIQAHLENATVTRANGTTATIVRVKLPSDTQIIRKNGRRLFEVQAAFNAQDTSALLQAAEDHMKNRFNGEYLQSKGLTEQDITYDYGQESQNADSFSALGIIFPLAIGLMYVLLAVQFRSFIQPLLIFMAIPFSLFGVFGGLYLTDNALSFFSMIGLVGLIGIAVNNSILLTDYANQERKNGYGPITAISHAVTKRFRPLITTTTTTVVALLPLALSDPFWEALAFTIIFGLISSTILVVLSFPYYYLATEWIRIRTTRIFKR